MPFSKDQFFQIFQNYNLAVGSFVWAFYAGALFVLYHLFRRTPSSNKLALGLLSFLWAWIGIIYHWIYFSRINPAARIFAGFFVLQAIVFAYATWKDWKLELSPMNSAKGFIQIFLLSYALIIYPVIGMVSGHGYPNGPIFGLPCPTTIFTFALLTGLDLKLKEQMIVSSIPILWAIIGTSPAGFFGVFEDYILGLSAALFIALQLISKSKSPSRTRNIQPHTKKIMTKISILILAGSLIMHPTSLNAETNQHIPEVPSQQFRGEHVEIKKQLSHVEEWTGTLSSLKPPEQKKTMSKIVSFFKEHIKPHAEWEEKKLYPAVDKRASKGSEPFTSTMRYEHKIVGRWIEGLEKEASSKSPDAKLFARKTDQLLGLINAHFEEEEEVLLPILDKSMTAKDFKEEILSGEH